MKAFVCLLTLLLLAPAAGAQSRRRSRGGKKPAPAAAPVATPGGEVKETTRKKEKVFDFTGFELAGSVRMPQLLYFLDRAEEELERASLERRSFVPAMLKSLDEEKL